MNTKTGEKNTKRIGNKAREGTGGAEQSHFDWIYQAAGHVDICSMRPAQSHLSRPALGPTQPPIQWVPGLSRG